MPKSTYSTFHIQQKDKEILKMLTESSYYGCNDEMNFQSCGTVEIIRREKKIKSEVL